MKKKSYESSKITVFLMFIIYIFFIFFVISLTYFKLSTYKIFNGVVVKDNLLQLLVNSYELKLFEENKYIYINNKKYTYKITMVERDLLKRESINYHSILIEFSGNGNLKENDIVRFSIFDKKIKIIEMFKIIWKEDLDGET